MSITAVPHRDLRFAFLNMKNHPRGTLMLDRLMSAGFVPAIVIDEDSPAATEGRTTQLNQLEQVAAFQPLPDTRRVCADRGITYEVVANHNDERVVELLRRTGVSLAVLGDARILAAHVIDAVPAGIVNTHPGVLPDVRGNNPYIWAAIHGLPQGATAHLINGRVDRGPILLCRHLGPPTGKGLPDLIHRLNGLCADVVVEALSGIVTGSTVATPQPDDLRMTFRAARQEIWDLADVILREQP